MKSETRKRLWPCSEFTIVAHRGAKAYAPENTISAMRKAVELGAEWVELDVHFIHGQMLVVHGPEVVAANGETYDIYSEPLDVLRGLDLGGGEHMPTLEEIIAFIRGRAKVNIELKGAGTAEPVAALLSEQLHAGRWTRSDVLVSSFRYDELFAFKKLLPQVPVGVLADESSRDFLTCAASLNASHLNISIELATPDLVQRARRLEMKVFVFTVNTVEEAKRLMGMGVWGIFTDYLELFRRS